MSHHVADGLAALRRGELLIVVDDPERENEGDFVVAADQVSPQVIQFMATEGRGLVCVALQAGLVDRLGLPQLPIHGPRRQGTAFTESVDLVSAGEFGDSATSRAACIRRLVDADSTIGEFQRPGHVFPLRARKGGVLQRRGHTEAAVDLAQMAGLVPAGVICEILNDDGSMARMSQLTAFGQRHSIPVIRMGDIVAYRRQQEQLIERITETSIPTRHGRFRAVGYRSIHEEHGHVALVFGEPEGKENVLVRIHSECVTGDALGSQRCDCGAQLHVAMEHITEAGEGIIVYLGGHEGRGIGLLDKLRAYSLQDVGLDTVEANLALGHSADERDYAVGAQVLSDLGVKSARLLTNNPDKQRSLTFYGVSVTERIPLWAGLTRENSKYIDTKRLKMGHDV